MRSSAGFTLLEVLLALVILATVIGVSVPYLSADTGVDPSASQSRFHASVAQAVTKESRSHASPLTFDKYADIAMLNGWVCRRLARNRPNVPAEYSSGEWLLITDGIHQSMHWARIPENTDQIP